MSIRIVTIRFSVGALLACVPFFAAASGSMGAPTTDIRPQEHPGGMTPTLTLSPQQLAIDAYNSGVAHKQHALSYLKDASTATSDKDRQKALKKADDQFQSAVKDQKRALAHNGAMYQAMNELGFAYRKLGNYDESLKQYDAALRLKPGYAPALEYRGEAYLALAKYDDSKNAYLELYRTDQDHAALLMQAFDEWVAKLGPSPTADASAFASWVSERKKVASVTQVEPGKLQRDW